MKNDNKDVKNIKGSESFETEKTAIKSTVSNSKSLKGENIFTAERKKAILRERAAILAEGVEETQDSGSYLDIIEFGLAMEKYGIQSAYVRQVCMLKDLISLPCVPRYVLGITSLHEQIISVIDIRTFFGLKSPGITNLNRVIVIYSEKDNLEFGILADEIYGVKSVAENTIQSSLATLSDNRAKYFYGLSEEQTIILDGYKILTDPDIIIK